MRSVKVTTGVILAGSGVCLMARIRGQGGQLLTAESLASITYQVANLTLGTVAAIGSLTPSQAVSDSLVQNDPRWTMDSSTQPGSDGSWGYNFLGVIPASAFGVSAVSAQPFGPAPASVCRIDVVMTPNTGDQPFRVSFQATVLPVYF